MWAVVIACLGSAALALGIEYGIRRYLKWKGSRLEPLGGITIGRAHGSVTMVFPQPVQFVVMKPEGAMDLARALKGSAARELFPEKYEADS